MRFSTVHKFLVWLIPALAGGTIACLGVFAALAQAYPKVNKWGENLFTYWEPIVTAQWFVALMVLLIAGYVWALVYTDQKVEISLENQSLDLLDEKPSQVSLDESRSLYTLRELACISMGVKLSEFNANAEAQVKASEILYYSRNALIRLADLQNHEWEAMKRGEKIDGFSREGISLDSVVTREEAETYLRPGWAETWLPVLDDQRKRRT